MKNKLFFRNLSALMIIIGVVTGSAFVIAEKKKDTAVEYEVNEYGQTYGSVDPTLDASVQEYPQLIAAIGIDGTEGYVYKADLDGEQPSNPEEALEYMEKLETGIENVKESGSEYLRYIPLYEEDGKTIIGQFGISYVGVSVKSD